MEEGKTAAAEVEVDESSGFTSSDQSTAKPRWTVSWAMPLSGASQRAPPLARIADVNSREPISDKRIAPKKLVPEGNAKKISASVYHRCTVNFVSAISFFKSASLKSGLNFDSAA